MTFVENDCFEEAVRMCTADGQERGVLHIWLGEISTFDGLIVNAVLRRLPIIKGTDFRHRIITQPGDGDGRPLITVVGSLRKARRNAIELLDKQFGVVDAQGDNEGGVVPHGQR